jgi:hypothetical protein
MALSEREIGLTISYK